MRVTEWDPARAPDSEVEAWRAIHNEVVTADAPDEPPWSADRLREYLTKTMPDEQRIEWLARADGEIVGLAGLLLGGDGDSCVVEVYVRPSARRRGVGRALLAAATERAQGARRQVMSAEVVAKTPAVDFYAALGFERTVTEVRNLLDLTGVDWERIGRLARRVASGYRIAYYPGGPPDDLLVPYAQAKTELRHHDAAGCDEAIASEANRLRASLRTLRARGMFPYVVVAEHESTGAVAGLTELVVAAQHPMRADQYDTLVVPGHRGYGLGLAMKSRMLLGLRADEPQLTTVQTWHALENEQMLRVNAELGFHPDRDWYEYEANVDVLAQSLRATSSAQ